MKQLKYFHSLWLVFTLHLMFVVASIKQDQQLTFHTIGISLCRAKCLTYGFCKFVAYDDNYLTCRLTNQVRTSGKKNGFTNIPQDFQVRNGTCSSERNDPAMRCVKTRSGKNVWIQESITSILEESVTTKRKSGPTVTTKCSDVIYDTETFQCGSESKPNCCLSWKWTGKACVKSTCNVGDFDQLQHHNLKDEFRLSIKATFLKRGSGQKLYLDFRNNSALYMRVHVASRRLLLGLTTPHKPRLLDEATQFPFKDGRAHTTVIIKDSSSYKVYVDGEKYLQTTDRFPRAGPYRLRVKYMHKNVIPQEIKMRTCAVGPCR